MVSWYRTVVTERNAVQAAGRVRAEPSSAPIRSVSALDETRALPLSVRVSSSAAASSLPSPRSNHPTRRAEAEKEVTTAEVGISASSRSYEREGDHSQRSGTEASTVMSRAEARRWKAASGAIRALPPQRTT